MSMKPIKIEIIDYCPVLTIEETKTVGALFWKKDITETRKFRATNRIAGKFWTWLEYPNMTLVPDYLSFQLDEWKVYLDSIPK